MSDVIVAGAGPAGSVTAALLVQLGFRVEVWESEAFPRFRIGESLPPRAVALLKHLGLEARIRAAEFAVMEGHTSVWGDSKPRRAVFDEGYGLQVERSRFDQILLEHCGAEVHLGRTAVGVIREGERVAGLRHSDGEARAEFIVIATGPRSRLAHAVSKPKVHLRQAAMYAYWRNSDHPEGSQANDTIVEAIPDGWIWSLRLSSDLRNVTVVCDKQSARIYKDAITESSFIRKLLKNAEPVRTPAGCDASWVRSQKFAEPGVLVVGDAASVIDPLSSQGVYKALCSAMSAAAVINTCLRRPHLSEIALRYHDEEERRSYDGHASGAIEAFRRERRWADRPFWSSRHQLQGWDVPARHFSPRVAHSIEAGRAGELRLRRAPGVTVTKRPIINGPFVDIADFVISPQFQYGYRGLHGSTFVELFHALSAPKSLGEILMALHARDTETLLKLIAYMYREGLVETA